MNSMAEVGRAKVSETIRAFIVENFLFGVEDESLTPDASFLETGIIDSTGILELVGFVESQFGVKVEDDEMLPTNLDSLANLAAYVARKREG